MNLVKPDPYRPCPCGSGRKFKFCCRAKGQEINTMSPLALAKNAVQYPVVECSINSNWQAQGLANIAVVRQLPNGNLLFGMYLVDFRLLGVKNAFFHANISPSGLQSMLMQAPTPLQPITYEAVRSIIFGSIEMARTFGFEPHPDWQDAQHLVEPERPFSSKFTVTTYIPGPNDDANAIIDGPAAK